jgi:DNA-binding response OmpR family regulator
LCVHDNADTADSLALLLQLAGAEVSVARDGPTGLLAARDFRPRPGILDPGLPGPDGPEVAWQLRGSDQPPCVAAVSDSVLREDYRCSREAGIDMHLAKPADPDFLISLLPRLHN